MKNMFKTGRAGIIIALLLIISSCEDFLDRPTEDNYSIDGFYQTDEQCYQAANILYNSPWYDFQRGFLSIGDVLAGNIYKGGEDKYLKFNLTTLSDDADLINASNSLWLVNGHCNAVIENIASKAGSGVSEETKNTVTGEAMVWKAMAYFYMVRIWGAIPIIHSNSDVIGAGTANTLKKNRVEDVYEYILRTLNKAESLLPDENATGRINKYSAYGLMAKVYLTRSGYGSVDGNRNQEDLDNAKKYAKMVIDKYGDLEPNYADLFRISTGNYNKENLLSWRWVAGAQWTSQNSLQSDNCLNGFTGLANDSWGTWVGLTVDLQRLFNEDAGSKERNNTDSRRKATMMMFGDHYPYFWRESGGFTATWDNDNNVAGATFGVGTGANMVKHIVGHYLQDHKAEAGVPSQRMATNLATHILRLADIYLIYAEAILGNQSSTSDADAVNAFNKVRLRANPNGGVSSITFNDIFDERRRELAGEGDNWYDYVRLSYYNPQETLNKLNAQERGYYEGDLAGYYKGTTNDVPTVTANSSFKLSLTKISEIKLPFPDTDLDVNPNLGDDVDPVPFDFSTIGY